MNKGLEVIEAHELFGIPYDAIDVVVHPQSVVHSMVEFTDGAVVAQLSMPDMRLPIGYALAYPDRLSIAVRGHRLGRAVRARVRATRPRRCSGVSTWPTGPAGPATWPRPGSAPPTRWPWPDSSRPHLVEGHRRRGREHPRPLRAVDAGWPARTADPPDRRRARRRRHRPPGGRSGRARPGGGGVSTTDLRPPSTTAPVRAGAAADRVGRPARSRPGDWPPSWSPPSP